MTEGTKRGRTGNDQRSGECEKIPYFPAGQGAVFKAEGKRGEVHVLSNGRIKEMPRVSWKNEGDSGS